ncbi:hypothetical protein [Thalassomonas sp. M1454]|uniref:hypothetical protein n=1 Tax=Thalassomonas sp. M1454 TaxID=2594477 RepID=UPI00117FEA2F|nr:hypothetical protein [Thalassomonas sp. M1454]TRX53439.1 hypothetical protein FNN08_14290 [Thalassomonas sp. M1454]
MGFFSRLFGSCSNEGTRTGPLTNIDGTPMCGSIDINGNPYGVTDDDDPISSCDPFDDDFGSGCGFDEW